jgi:hypothetical protein
VDEIGAPSFLKFREMSAAFCGRNGFRLKETFAQPSQRCDFGFRSKIGEFWVKSIMRIDD